MTEVYRLPPEPPVGTVVEVLSGTFAGGRYQRMTRESGFHWRALDFGQVATPGPLTTWRYLFECAGPDGVRVVEEG
jgi:hypothetical protein